MLLASSICGKQASRGTPYDNTLPVFLALHSHGFALFRGSHYRTLKCDRVEPLIDPFLGRRIGVCGRHYSFDSPSFPDLAK